MSRAPASLREVVEDCESGQIATVKKELLAGAAALAKAAEKCGIRSGGSSQKRRKGRQ